MSQYDKTTVEMVAEMRGWGWVVKLVDDRAKIITGGKPGPVDLDSYRNKLTHRRSQIEAYLRHEDGRPETTIDMVVAEPEPTPRAELSEPAGATTVVTSGGLPVSFATTTLEFSGAEIEGDVLPDGSVVFSKRAIVKWISAGRDGGNLDAYINGIPGKPKEFSLGERPYKRHGQNPTRHGVSELQFAQIIEMYARAWWGDELQPNQMHIGERCARAGTASLATVIREMFQRKTGYKQSRDYAAEARAFRAAHFRLLLTPVATFPRQPNNAHRSTIARTSIFGHVQRSSGNVWARSGPDTHGIAFLPAVDHVGQ